MRRIKEGADIANIIASVKDARAEALDLGLDPLADDLDAWLDEVDSDGLTGAVIDDFYSILDYPSYKGTDVMNDLEAVADDLAELASRKYNESKRRVVGKVSVNEAKAYRAGYAKGLREEYDADTLDAIEAALENIVEELPDTPYAKFANGLLKSIDNYGEAPMSQVSLLIDRLNSKGYDDYAIELQVAIDDEI